MENSISAHSTNRFNFAAAKITVVCSIVYSVILICLRAQFLFVDDTYVYDPIFGLFTPNIVQGIGTLLYVATFYYLYLFFKQLGYKNASVCISLIIVLSLIEFVIGFFNDYYRYRELSDASYPMATIQTLDYLFSLALEVLKIIDYVLRMVLSIIILGRKTDRTTYRMLKPMGIWYMIYTIICILLYILGTLFFSFVSSGDVVQLDAGSQLFFIQFQAFILSIIYFIPSTIFYIALVNMYSKYQKMIESSDNNN